MDSSGPSQVGSPLFNTCIRGEMAVSDDFFDFGFTAVDESELKAVQEVAAKAESLGANALNTQEKLDKLYNAITPLLNNLKKNPEKEYILWPNRIEKVEQFETHLLNIYRSQKKKNTKKLQVVVFIE